MAGSDVADDDDVWSALLLVEDVDAVLEAAVVALAEDVLDVDELALLSEDAAVVSADCKDCRICCISATICCSRVVSVELVDDTLVVESEDEVEDESDCSAVIDEFGLADLPVAIGVQF